MPEGKVRTDRNTSLSIPTLSLSQNSHTLRIIKICSPHPTPVCVCVHVRLCAQSKRLDKEAVCVCPGIGIVTGCKPSNLDASNSSPLEEQCAG